jgi:4-methyl-5(b-hydroxyethyl)-thiazole monophosphate biosynthesis
MNPRVLCIIGDGFEEIELISPVDLLRRAGTEVVVASIMPSIHVTGRSHVTIHADALLNDVMEQDFDLLFIPGGPGVKALRADGRAAKLAQRFAHDQKFVTAICAAPTVLHDAGLLQGRRFTAHFSVYAELPETLKEERVVRDGKLLTSRGAGTALEFGLTLVEALFGKVLTDQALALRLQNKTDRPSVTHARLSHPRIGPLLLAVASWRTIAPCKASRQRRRPR